MTTLERLVNDMARADPAFARDLERLFPRAPHFRYFWRGKRAYCWTVEPARDSKRRLRYASFRARLSRDAITPIASSRRAHAKRRDAKARALRLYEAGERRT